MSLGIVLHASLRYWPRLADIGHYWPADDSQSVLTWLIFESIHVWRMPGFFLLAGFFAHLVLERRSTRRFIRDRLQRIALPLAIFGPIMVVVIPPIWIYGYFGHFELERTTDLSFSGELFAHLWFLYYLIIMYAALVLMRQAVPWLGLAHSFGKVVKRALYTSFPVVLMVLAAALLVLRAGNESKPVWPINWPDLLYGALFFFYGFGLYSQRELIKGFTRIRVLVALLIAAELGYCVHIGLVIVIEAIKDEGTAGVGLLELIDRAAYGATAVCFAADLIGLFERWLKSPRPAVRWLADSSYWIYIMHLPVVALLTFYLFRFDWGAEVKFLVTCMVTAALGVVTYRYVVRYTPLGTMLNGKRVKTAG